MRILETGLNLARIAGPCAGLRFARHALKLAVCDSLATLSALCLLWRAKLLAKPRSILIDLSDLNDVKITDCTWGDSES